MTESIQETPQIPFIPEPTPSVVKETIRFRGRKIKPEELPENQGEHRQEAQDLTALYEKMIMEFREGEIVKGKIIAIGDKDISVDIGFKSEGTVAMEEFAHPEEIKVGDDIEVYLDRVEDAEGQLLLSKKKADFLKIWERIGETFRTEEIVRGRIMRRIKGGFVVDLLSVDAFLPGSQIDVHPVRDFDALVGQDMDFRIVKLNDARKNIVVSHKVIVEKSLAGIREKVLGELKVGDVMEGTVKNITDFGVFVDLGGVDGLLHITDLSWGRVSHPSEVVQLDQKITVRVLDYDKERQRISIGLKQLQPHPWEGVETKYPVAARVHGRVVSIARYGAFIELEKGLEGLVHISEMSWTQHVKHPSALLSVGDEVDVVVLNIDKENRKISLGLKQVEPDPWENLEVKYSVGSRHMGRVRDLVPFGAFVELEDGIDGLVHISDLSWTKRVRHPGEILKKGEEVDVIVLGFDRNERRIALGLKQAQTNPWDEFEQQYAVGTQTTGRVARVLEKGVVVELPRDVEGFVPNSQLKRLTRGPKQVIAVGDDLQLEVIEFDKESKKIILAAQAPAGAEGEVETDDETMKQYIVGTDLDTPASPEADSANQAPDSPASGTTDEAKDEPQA
ncbi:30S ribosomal protein S1 [candidate division KSB1 bacterium]|nr:MAG: 30S ribosomal protein S1 [candidate division KSB1 bacterium]